MENPAIASFLQEARDILEGLEALLLDLESNASSERIDAVFRALHTIKGSGAMFGFGALARFTHHFEDAFDQLREGRLQVGQALIDLSLRARDRMQALLDQGGDKDDSEESAILIQALADLTSDGRGPAPRAAPPAPHGRTPDSAEQRTWLVRFRPEPSALRNGMRPDLLIAELAAIGRSEIAVDTGAVPALDTLDPAESLLAWTVRLETHQPRSMIEGVFLFADEADLAIEDVTPAPTAQSRPDALSRSPEAGAAPPGPAVADRSGETVRVPAAKLDEIMNRLGELVITEARLQKIADTLRDVDLEAVVEEMERLVNGLREATLSIRMLPIETVFGKFRRVVRDLSVDLGKQVRLVTDGGETEIDKNVIDRLTEPLVHMIRNSIDHGLEPAEQRKDIGKPAIGVVRLSARQEGGEVLIALEDDGRGLDSKAIHRKAVERGLLAPEATPSEADLHQLIFAPGFSTAEKLSSVSGRGVGMDAVRSTVDALRGRVEVQSRPGAGTRVTLCLPVSLAIIDGLLVRLGTSVFVIPLAAVEECVEFDVAEARRDSGRTMLQIREEMVPFVDLTTAFSMPPSQETRRRVVCVRVERSRIGLVVDDILGRNQTVIKTFSVFHRDVEGFAGATILGDGSVALILDVAGLSRRAIAGSQTSRQPAA